VAQRLQEDLALKQRMAKPEMYTSSSKPERTSADARSWDDIYVRRIHLILFSERKTDIYLTAICAKRDYPKPRT
jgi:hypothetical protein